MGTRELDWKEERRKVIEVAYLFVMIILVPPVNGNKKAKTENNNNNKTQNQHPQTQFVVLKLGVSKPLEIHSMASLRLGSAGDSQVHRLYLRNSTVTPASRTDKALCLMSLL